MCTCVTNKSSSFTNKTSQNVRPKHKTHPHRRSDSVLPLPWRTSVGSWLSSSPVVHWAAKKQRFVSAKGNTFDRLWTLCTLNLHFSTWIWYLLEEAEICCGRLDAWFWFTGILGRVGDWHRRGYHFWKYRNVESRNWLQWRGQTQNACSKENTKWVNGTRILPPENILELRKNTEHAPSWLDCAL